MNEEIASTSLICVTPTGERLPVTVSIGRPVQDGTGFWVCPLSLSGLYPRISPMRSDDSLHALCLSLNLIHDLLAGFSQDGGRILIAGTEDEQELPLDAYFPSRSTSAGGLTTMQREPDDGRRPEWGVGVFALDTGNGFRLTFDRLRRTGEGKPHWESWSFVTHGSIDRAKFLTQQFSEEEVAALGRTVLGILAALVESDQKE